MRCTGGAVVSGSSNPGGAGVGGGGGGGGDAQGLAGFTQSFLTGAAHSSLPL